MNTATFVIYPFMAVVGVAAVVLMVAALVWLLRTLIPARQVDPADYGLADEDLPASASGSDPDSRTS